MADEKQVKVRIQLKADTKENWNKASNFTPKKNEPIFYTDTGEIKLGDGVTNVNDLPQYSVGKSTGCEANNPNSQAEGYQTKTETRAFVVKSYLLNEEDTTTTITVELPEEKTLEGDYGIATGQHINIHNATWNTWADIIEITSADTFVVNDLVTTIDDDGGTLLGVGVQIIINGGKTGTQLYDLDSAGWVASGHAEGSQSIAGLDAHAEGLRTEARGIGSHSEGKYSEAMGDYSHVEGYGTLAFGRQAHAEGGKTTAMGNESHAEGESARSYAEAIEQGGSDASLEGLTKDSNEYIAALLDVKPFTLAKGVGAHAEGSQTIALGKGAHSEGIHTKALHSSAHAEGSTTTASGEDSHAEGYSTLASGFRAHAEGRKTQAIANYTHAEGNESIAGGEVSHAEGSGTKAYGQYSHAGGLNTTTGIKDLPSTSKCFYVEGQYYFNNSSLYKCIEKYGEIEAYYNYNYEEVTAEDEWYIQQIKAQALVIRSAFDFYTTTISIMSNDYGYHSIPSLGLNENAYVIVLAAPDAGNVDLPFSLPSGKGAFAHGRASLAQGDYTTALGQNTQALGLASFAEGRNTLASDEYSPNTTDCGGAHAEGHLSKAQREAAHAEGYDTLASGRASHAEGQKTQATGNGAHAEGRETIASGEFSHAAGKGTKAIGSNQTVVGQYNSSSSSALFMIGNGTSDSARSNIVSVYEEAMRLNGNLYITGTIENSNSSIFGPFQTDEFYTWSNSCCIPTGSFRLEMTSKVYDNSVEQNPGWVSCGIFNYTDWATNEIVVPYNNYCRGTIAQEDSNGVYHSQTDFLLSNGILRIWTNGSQLKSQFLVKPTPSFTNSTLLAEYNAGAVKHYYRFIPLPI